MSGNQTQKPFFSIDLHSHTTCSDGSLSPEVLVARAVEQGVEYLAITDHDTISGISPARYYIEEHGLSLTIIEGIELSSCWEGQEIHVLGYQMAIDDPEFKAFLANQADVRWRRARKIADCFEKKNIKSTFELASDLSLGNPPGRLHFAQALLNLGIVKTRNQAFREFLATGKSCYVTPEWPDIRKVIAAIQQAGGKAFLAHPYGYQISKSQMRRLIKQFSAFNGDGIEAVSGSQTLTQSEFLFKKADEHGLSVSIGSDFHAPSQWSELGKIAVPESMHKELIDYWSC